jgi:hypothetical protein
MPRALDELLFHVDHVVAVQHGGATTAANLAYSCGSCNLHKGPNLSSIDPTTGRRAWLFNPRVDDWDRHFRWVAAQLVGRTARGRATVSLLDINAPVNAAARSALMDEGRY